MKWRAVSLALALVATLTAAFFAPPPEGALVEPTARRVATAVAPQPGAGESRTASVLVIRPREAVSGKPAHAGFDVPAWAERPALTPPTPMAAPAPLPLVAPVPMAPPLPFKVLGRYVGDGKPALFLQYNEQNLVVRAGDTLVGQYKVESLDEAALTLLHLPTNQKQTLAVSATR